MTPQPVRLVLAQADDPGLDTVVDSLESIGRAGLEVLPRLAIGLVVLVIVWIVANLLRGGLQRRLAALRTPSFGRVFATRATAGIKIVGILAALAIIFPSVDVATMLAGFGVLGIAAGFAFQDILSNLLAGLLLIFRQPFVSGDQIEVNGIRGTVEGITMRETRITTFDHRLVIVPNQDVYTNAIEVQTAHEAVRSSFVTGVGYDSDLDQVRSVALEALAPLDGVHGDPAPQAYFTEHGASSVVLDVRYWTSSQQAEIRRVQDQVAQALYDGFNRAGIDIPFDIMTLEPGAELSRALAGRSTDEPG